MEENKNTTKDTVKGILETLSENHEYIEATDTDAMKRFLLGRSLFDRKYIDEELLRHQLIYYRMKNKKYGYKKY